MANLLIHDIDLMLQRQLTERACADGCSLSDEVKFLIRRGIATQALQVGVGTQLFAMLPDEWRGDDLVFEPQTDASAARTDMINAFEPAATR
jgi:plasmid stability protein